MEAVLKRGLTGLVLRKLPCQYTRAGYASGCTSNPRASARPERYTPPMQSIGGERVVSLELIVTGWEYDNPDSIQQGMDTWEIASELGLQAESLRREFNTYLVSQCERYRSPACQ